MGHPPNFFSVQSVETSCDNIIPTEENTKLLGKCIQLVCRMSLKNNGEYVLD